jgi:hypothetical protein
MRYRVKLSYPTIIKLKEQEHLLFPGQEVELPEDTEIVNTYVGLGYLKPIETQTRKNKKEAGDAS